MMTAMKVPQPVLLVVGWLLIVSASSSLSWAVISRVGANLGGAGAATGGPTASTLQTATLAPTVSGSAVATLTKTWVGAAGRLRASCLQGEISLTSAEPDVGYRVDVISDGPVTISVRFIADDSSGVQVDSSCGTAGPAFSTRRF